MMEMGLLDETRHLAERYGWDVPAMSGLGYAQLCAYLRGETTLGESVLAIKRETRRFVRQQANWFRPPDLASNGDAKLRPGKHRPHRAGPENFEVHWFNATDLEGAPEAIEHFVRDWLENPISLGG
jgi:tRNA A37 N6-isopentenylltransferase MiaA